MVSGGGGKGKWRTGEVVQEMRFEDFLRYRLPYDANSGLKRERRGVISTGFAMPYRENTRERSTLMKEIQVAKVRGLQRRKPLTYS